MLGTPHQFSKFIQVDAKEGAKEGAKGQIAARTMAIKAQEKSLVLSIVSLLW